MTQLLLSTTLLCMVSICHAQTDPAIINWLQNTTGTATYYMSGNSTPINNGILYNCQEVCYTNDHAYITTTGVPAYPTGPFGNNPTIAQNQNAIFKIPLDPQEEPGTKTQTTLGRIGVFINGVSIFDSRDGVGWNSMAGALCGGPGNPACPGGPNSSSWNRDAVKAELGGFDCSKAHPAQGNYHHHQNPSAFKWDLLVISDICNLYDADGLYAIDSSQHAPLIGFAYDGFPIYGAYGYLNADGTGGIVRIKSGFQLRNITVRTHYANGNNVPDGPPVNATYYLGYFREDYEFINHPGQDDYLDRHNGRFCVTPEYPAGTYAYFATVDENWNSAYPYIIGPRFNGIHGNRLVTSIDEPCTVYSPPLAIELIDFRAALLEEAVLLSWETLTEVENDFFSIERSFDGINFDEIARIPGQGNSDQKQFYSYLDTLPLTEIRYYRLKQTDYSGHSEYGKTVVLENEAIHDFSLKIFPNPSTEFVAVQIMGLNKRKVTIRLFDLNGVLLKTNYINAGSTISYIETSTLYDGDYVIVVSDGKRIFSQKIAVLH